MNEKHVVLAFCTGTLALTSRMVCADLVIDKNLPAGNIAVGGIDNDTVYLANEIRDTTSWWFYWAFRVTGAEGRTFNFKFTNGAPVCTRGPVISYDRGKNWDYAAPGTWTTSGFTHTFPPGPNSNEVWFAMGMNYTQRDWDAFLTRHRTENAFIRTNVLCLSRRGRAVEMARVGCLNKEPAHRIWLSARHHAQEMMANYVLEGILDAALAPNELGAWMRENVQFLVVPFVDKDGVEDGDQGKNRRPHDHNRDYNETCLYPETQAIRDQLGQWAEGKLAIILDIHCPWVRGPHNECLYQVYTEDAANAQAQTRFGKLLEQTQRGGMRYRQADDLPFGQAWNNGKNYSQGLSFNYWAIKNIPGIRLGTTYEVPFASANGAVVTRETCREIGEDTTAIFKQFLTQPTARQTSR